MLYEAAPLHKAVSQTFIREEYALHFRNTADFPSLPLFRDVDFIELICRVFPRSQLSETNGFIVLGLARKEGIDTREVYRMWERCEPRVAQWRTRSNPRKGSSS